MPELPEVETIRRGLQDNIVCKEIVHLDICWSGAIKSELDDFVEVINNNQFKEVERVGKLLILSFSDSDSYLLVHLKMTGQLIYKHYDQELVAGGHQLAESDLVLPNKHTHITITFADGSKLFYNDLRKFGYWKIVDSKGRKVAEDNYAIEPISKEFTLDYFKNMLVGRRSSIKSILLNQKLIAGIGNIYADEILFYAGVRPDREVDDLDEDDHEKIHKYCRQVLELAIKVGGTTFRNYLNHTGQKGSYVDYLMVYQRDGEVCKSCKTDTIKKIKVAGRGTHYCSRCQK